MRTIDWYFDFVSPYAYMQWASFDRLPGDVSVRFRPVLLAGLLKHWGTRGPAEIAPKRQFIYRHAVWMAQRRGIDYRMPPGHPFNPLPALRFAIALESRPEVIGDIFRYIWRDGRTLDDREGWTSLGNRFGVESMESLLSRPDVKEQLRCNTDEAIRLGVFGVPTFVAAAEVFWGFDATDMLLEFLADPGLFEDGEMQRVSDLPIAAARQQT